MPDPRITFKTPWLAALLAFLVPGAGHFYQGRYFKAAIYCVGILGLFVAGMRMSEWKAVYVHKPPQGQQLRGKQHALQFAAQLGVGLPAICAIIQNHRYYAPENEPVSVPDQPLRAPFEGEVTSSTGGPEGWVSGTIELAAAESDFGGVTTRGRFVGTTETGEPVELELGSHAVIEQPVLAERGRRVSASVIESTDRGDREVGGLAGTIPRPLWNWFTVPLDTQQERNLHKDLGKYFELAMVFTWVAGLLNLLAIWDAFDGPAYGYGDEPEQEDQGTEAKKQEPERQAEPKRAAAEVTA